MTGSQHAGSSVWKGGKLISDSSKIPDAVQQRDWELELIANEIHDGLLQYLVAAHMANEACRARLRREQQPLPHELTTVAECLQHSLRAGRELIAQLQHFPTTEAPLIERLDQLARAAETCGIQVTVKADEGDPLDAFTQLMLYRIAQEAMANVKRHSQATSASIHFAVTNSTATLIIQDNGRGFQIDDVSPMSFGLRSMRQRAKFIDAQLDIQSDATGTTIRLCKPNGAGGPAASGASL